MKLLHIHNSINVRNLLINIYFVLVVIFGMAISHGDTTLVTSVTIKVTSYIRLFLTVLCVGLFCIKKSINKTFYIFLPIIFWCIVHFHSYTRQTLNIVTLVASVLFFFFKDEEKKILFEKYKKFVIVTSAIGIVLYIIYIFKIPFPYRIVDWYGDNVNHSNYIDFRIGYLFINKSGGVVRLCGLFNEAGYLGTFAAFFLCADGLNLKKRENWILLVAGILTFSLAFFAILIIYYGISSYQNRKKMIIILLLFIFYIFILPNIKFSNTGVQFFVNRFTITEGHLTGNNRTSSMYDSLFLKWQKSDRVAFGYGAGYKSSMLKADLGNDSTYKTYLIDYGVIGFLAIYVSLLICALKKNNNIYGILYIIVYFLSVYQRPNIYTVPYFVMLFGAIAYINQRKEINGTERATHEKNNTLYRCVKR